MNTSIISFEPDPDYGYEGEATLHSLVFGLEAQVQFWRAEALRLHAAAAECDALHDRIDQLNVELDAAITEKNERDARWQSRFDTAERSHNAEYSVVNRQFQNELDKLRAERDALMLDKQSLADQLAISRAH